MEFDLKSNGGIIKVFILYFALECNSLGLKSSPGTAADLLYIPIDHERSFEYKIRTLNQSSCCLHKLSCIEVITEEIYAF